MGVKRKLTKTENILAIDSSETREMLCHRIDQIYLMLDRPNFKVQWIVAQ